jgi:hypothetical protein
MSQSAPLLYQEISSGAMPAHPPFVAGYSNLDDLHVPMSKEVHAIKCNDALGADITSLLYVSGCLVAQMS